MSVQEWPEDERQGRERVRAQLGVEWSRNGIREKTRREKELECKQKKELGSKIINLLKYTVVKL